MSEYDVVIIGGGPAGTAAAITCAASGLSVALVERDRFPREHPGETLHPGVEPLLSQLGVWDEVLEASFVRHEGHILEWGAEKRFVPFGDGEDGTWLGFQACRDKFDGILLERARGLGVRVLQPSRTLRACRSGKRITGVETTVQPVHGSFVIDAAGSRHWLANQTEAAIVRYTPRLIVRYVYVATTESTVDELPLLTADYTGWTWTAKVRSDLYQKSRMNFRNSANEATESFKISIAGFPRETKGADMSWRLVTRPAEAGYFLAGDAASVLDPISSHGVLKALMSGIMIGHLITNVKAGQISEAAAAAIYSSWISNWFFEEAIQLCELYGSLPSPPDWLVATRNRLFVDRSSRQKIASRWTTSADRHSIFLNSPALTGTLR